MAAKYCTCGSKTEYTVKIPTFCSACGQPFIKAFTAATTTKVETTSPSVVPTYIPAPKPIVTKVSRPTRENEEFDDYYDKDEMQAMAAELAASVGSFFVVDTQQMAKGVKAGDVLSNPDAFNHLGQRGSVEVDLPPSS